MIESFIKYLQFEKRVSPHTVLAYENDLLQFQKFLQNCYSENKSESADYGMIRSWIVALSEENIEPASINRKIACLRTYYKFLMRQEVISKNPMTKIKVLKTKKKLPNFVKEKDILNVLDNNNTKTNIEKETQKETPFENARNQLILELFYATGIRLSELINLKESNINLRNQTIKVLGKRNKERIIPFPDGIIPSLENYKSLRNKEITKKDNGHLFVTKTGDQCYPMLVNRVIKKYLMDIPLEKRSPHVLRHTYATHLLNKGADINAVKELLGHTSLAATQVYTHNSMEKLKKIFEQAHPKA